MLHQTISSSNHIFFSFSLRSFLLIAGLFGFGWVQGQSVIFSENMGNGGGQQSIAATTFQNPGLSFTGSAQTRTTGASSGYAGASGGKNVFFTNSGGPDFQIANINTAGFSDLKLSFGAFKSTTASDLTDLMLEYSTNGTTYSQVSFPAQPTGFNTANWRLISEIELPAGAENAGNLRLRWTQSSTSTQFRVDDIVLTGFSCESAQITSFSPLEGPAGTKITVLGSDFENPSDVTDIEIDGVSVTDWTLFSDTEIELVIPSSGGSGSINIFRGNCVASSTMFNKISNECTVENTDALIISELSDPQNNFSTDRYIEIYNPTNNTISLNNWEVKAVSNLDVCATWILSGSIAAGEAKTCGSSQAINGGPHDFINAGNEWNNASGNCITNWNGQYRDGAYLFYNNTLIDNALPDNSDNSVLLYNNGSLVRNTNICSPSTSFILSEWTELSAANAGEGGSTPGSHTSCISEIATGQQVDDQPADQIDLAICEDGSFNFTVSNFSGAPTYQWYATIDGNTFTPLVNGAEYEGVNTAQLTVNNIEDKDGMQFYSTASDGDCMLVTEAAILRLQEFTGLAGLWTNSNGNENWFDCRNWADGRVPDPYTNVQIPAGTSDPTVENTGINATTANLQIGANRTVFINTEDPSKGLEIHGNLTGPGNIEVLESSLIFTGSEEQSIDADILILEGILNINKPQNHLITNTDIDMLESDLELNGGVLKLNNGAKLLNEGGTFSPGADDRFVDGIIQRTGFTASEEVIFPTGNIDLGGEGPADDVLFFQPASLANASTNTTLAFEIQYFHENFNNTFDPPTAELGKVSTCNYWMIDVVNGTPNNVIVGLSWNEAYCFEVEDPNALTVARWNGFDWSEAQEFGLPTFTSTPGNVTGWVYSPPSVINFSPFAIGSIGNALNVLPIELLSFTAKSLDNQLVETHWATASETNNDFFTVERSRDAVLFEAIGTVPGAGNSNQRLDYTLVDDAPYSGISYYRLKQTDYDGSFAYSDIVAVQIGTAIEAFSLDQVYRSETGVDLQYQAFAPYLTVEIFDLTGKRVFGDIIENVDGQSTIHPNLARGAYIVRLMNGMNSATAKFFF